MFKDALYFCRGRIFLSKVIVVGGGAAGMMAAYAAGMCGHEVTLYEKNEKIGKKIYITGKGRCNFKYKNR